jgi:hypothetical protein
MAALSRVLFDNISGRPDREHDINLLSGAHRVIHRRSMDMKFACAQVCAYSP